MITPLPLLSRWRWGLGIAGALAFLGLALAASHYRHAYHAEKALRKADRAAYAAAQSEATVIAKRALDAAEARYRSKANEADQAFQSKLADARRSADQYVLTHRMRAYAQGPTSGTVSSAADRGPGVPASLPADAVMVSEGDLQACTDAVTYAIGAHEWALGLIPPPTK